MKLSVQVVLHADEGTETVVHEVFHPDRGPLTPDSLGLELAEAKNLLAAVQSALVTEQVNAGVAAQVACPHCGRARRHKDKPTIVVGSLFGTLRLPSPRWWHCPPAQLSPPETLSAPGSSAARAEDPRVDVPGIEIRRADLLRGLRHPARRAAIPGPGAAPHRDPSPRLGGSPTPGRRARRRAVLLHRGLPAGLVHLLLQLRTRVLNDNLATDFHRWYPNFTHTTDHQKLTA